MPASSTNTFCFAEFELHRDALELTRNGKRIRLQIQPFRVLELLLERAGEVVAREEFRARVWPSNVYVDFDHGLNNAITRLREALGDSTDNPRYIETLHRVGYRFICPISSGATDTVLDDAKPAVVPPPLATRSKPSLPLLAFGAMLFAIAVLVALTVIRRDASHGAVTAIRSIAVLQFRDLSEDGSDDYFAAGMTEALITRLAQNPDLRVVSRRAAARHQDPEKPIAKIARDLQVDGVIDGSIVRQGNRVRIDVRLVRATDESHAWAQSYERSIQDVFQLQRELADDIGSEVDAGVGGKLNERVSVARSDDVKAYEFYLQGRHQWNQRNRQSVSNSLGYFQKAIRLDPDFAAAHAGLAQAYATLGGQTLVKSMPAEEVRPAAMAAARRAIELDTRLAEAHWAMAAVLSQLFPQSRQTDAEIEREYLLALRLNPASADTRHSYGNFLSNRLRSQEAIAQYREAQLLDPLSPNIAGRLGLELAENGRVEEGLAFMQRAVEIEPWQFNAQLRLGLAYAAIGRYEEATRAFAVAERVSPGSPQTLAGRGFVMARSGDTAGATEILETLLTRAEAIDAPFLVAMVYVGLQDREGALEWLEKAAPSSNLLRRGGLYALDKPVYDWLRNDPRFKHIRQLVERAGRDPYS